MKGLLTAGPWTSNCMAWNLYGFVICMAWNLYGLEFAWTYNLYDWEFAWTGNVYKSQRPNLKI